MNVCLLSICFFRHEEIKASLMSIYDSLLSDTNVKFCAVELPSPNTDKVVDVIKNLPFKNKYLLQMSKNHVSAGLLSATLDTDLLNDVDYVAVTEADIRILTKGGIESSCEILRKNGIVGYIGPEYNIDDPYHRECYNKWVPPTYKTPFCENVYISLARGFQILIWRKQEWYDFCRDVRNGMYVSETTKSYGIIDGNSADWIKKKCKIIGVKKDFEMVHTGWDVYNTPSCDQEYLDYKNKLIETDDIWSTNNTKGNEIYDFTFTKI